jgi:hypothetical protein
MPHSLVENLQKFSTFKQKIYDNMTLSLLDNPSLAPFISFYHRFLFAFRIYSVDFCNFLERFVNLQVAAIIISLILSRLHFGGALIIFCLVFLRLDFAVLSMARFYQKRPERLKNLYHIQQRYMWSRVVKVAEEAASNPNVQTAATLVVGALAWKTLDVYDTQAQKEIAEEDRIAQKEIAEQDRIAQKEIAEQDRIAENQRHADEIKMREAELTEAKESRKDENRRHQEDIELRNLELKQNNN